MIISEHRQFESYQRSVFNTKTFSNDIKYVLRDIQGSDIDTKKMEDCFEIYYKTYKKLIYEYLSVDINFTQFISNLKNITSELKSTNNNKINWNGRIERELPVLIGHVFALWSLLSANNYYNISEKNSLFQPHPAQVIAIFRMLGFGLYSAI
jgi:hypothetical protein